MWEISEDPAVEWLLLMCAASSPSCSPYGLTNPEVDENGRDDVLRLLNPKLPWRSS